MQYIEKSQKSVSQVVENIQSIVANYKFGVLHIHNVKDTLNSKGFDFDNECQILDVCNPNIAKEILSQDMSMSVIMPCKISVYSDNGETNISMNSLVQLIDDLNPDFLDLAQSTQETLLKIIDESK
jgi:uncharacterized protein (DUF302 family)